MISDPANLLPYQIPATAGLLAALRRYGAALDASETGVGKTYAAMAVARELGVAPLVVCPKAVLSSWARVAEFLGGRCYPIGYEKLKTGKTEFGRWETVRVVKKLRLREGSYQAEDKVIRRWVFDSEVPLIIFDEAHRCKGTALSHTDNSRLMVAAARQGIPTLALSATIAENPTQMRALGLLLKLHDGKAFNRFCKMFGCSGGDGPGKVVFVNKGALKRLHGHLFPDRGVRVTRDALGSAFPDCQTTAELYDLPKAGELDALYEDMHEALGRLQDKMQEDADLEHPLTKLLRARQKVELLKVPLFESLFVDAIENGLRPVIFVNFNETIDALIERLGKNHTLSIIRGNQSQSDRDREIDAFQNNVSDGCLANGQAGGVGVSLHDVHGGHPRIAYVSPGWSSMQLVQTLGRVWRQGAKTKAIQRLVLISKSVEQKIHSKLKDKLANLSLINDGDLRDPFST